MSESAKLFDLLDAPAPAPSPAQLCAGRWRDIALNIRSAIRDGVTQMAVDAAALGTTAIYAEMSPDVAAAFSAGLPLLQALWEASASVPFPILPADPPAPPEEDAPNP